jgi:hypothetical protein
MTTPTFEEKASAIFAGLNDMHEPFQLRTNQHKNENIVNGYISPSNYDIFDMTKPQYPTEQEKIEQVADIEKIQLQQQNNNTNRMKKVILCVKRKRDEDPIDDFYLEVEEIDRKQKRVKNIHDVTNLMQKSFYLEDKTETRFSLLETFSTRQIDTDKKALEKLRERKTLKASMNETSMKDKNLKKMKENKHKVRFAKVTEKRSLDDETSIVSVDLRTGLDMEEFNDPSLENYRSLLRDHYSQQQSNDDQYYYDYYFMNDELDEHIENATIVKMEPFDEENMFVSTEYNPKDDSDYDSEDSNASYHERNDYPDEEDENHCSDEEEFYHNINYDPSYRRPKRIYDESDEDDEYLQNDNYY